MEHETGCHAHQRSLRGTWVLLAAALVALAAAPAHAVPPQGLVPVNIIYVDAVASGETHDGTSWTTAFLYLADGLAAAGVAGAGTQVWVAQGVYYPDEGNGRTDNASNQ